MIFIQRYSHIHSLIQTSIVLCLIQNAFPAKKVKGPGAKPSYHWARGRVHPGEVYHTQGWHFHTYVQFRFYQWTSPHVFGVREEVSHTERHLANGWIRTRVILAMTVIIMFLIMTMFVPPPTGKNKFVSSPTMLQMWIGGQESGLQANNLKWQEITKTAVLW